MRTSILRSIDEETLNDAASGVHGRRVATPDYTGRPYRDQEFRCYPDLSEDVKVWITLRASQPKNTLIVRVSPNTLQREIEVAASEEWRSHVIFKSHSRQYWIRMRSIG
jgi:hypothetical protein